MDFNDTPEEAAFRSKVRQFLEEAARPKSRGRSMRIDEVDSPELVAQAKAWQRRKAEAGFACISWPKEHGGHGLPAIYDVIYYQEEALFDVPPNIFLIGLGMCIPTLLRFATPEQKARYAPPAVRGEDIWCQLFSEPAAGSDLAGIRAKAVRDGEAWLVSGQKVWTSGAHHSQYGLLLARTNPDAPKHKGLTMFFLDMKSPGIEMRPINQMSSGANFNEVFFADVRIPDTQRLGDIDGGWNVALVTLMNERLAVTAAKGIEIGEILKAAQEIPNSTGEGSALQDPVFRSRLADWYVAAEGLRLTRFRSMTALSKGEAPGPEASIAKIVMANLVQDISNSMIDLLGAYGVIDDPDLSPQQALFQQEYLHVPGIRIAGGTDEVLRNVIGERVLKLPPEPRADKNAPFNQPARREGA